MPIRFPCPACRQPLEVDDDWAGQSVACPYCRRVVTAPAASTWPGHEIPMASPAREAATRPPPAPGRESPAFHPPPPPVGYKPAQPASTNTAGGALVLALVGAGLSILAAIFWLGAVMSALTRQIGENPTQSQITQACQEMMEQGRFPRPLPITYLVVLAAITCLAGIVMGARAMTRQESGRGMAITACILGAAFLLCPLFWGVLLAAPTLTGGH